MRKIVLTALVVVGASFFVTWGALGSDTESDGQSEGNVETNEVIEQSFDVTGGVLLDFRGLRGSLVVRSGKPGQVSLSATKRARGADYEEARRNLEKVKVDIKQSNNAIVITGGAGSTGGWFRRPAANKYQVDYDLTVQEDIGVRVSDAEGSIRIADIRQGVNVVGTKVNASFTNVQGGISVRSETGSIRASAADGDLRFEAKTAPVFVEKVSGPGLTINSGADITVRDAEIRGDLVIRATSGNVIMQRLRARTISADVRTGTTKITEATADGTFTVLANDGKITVNRAQAATFQATGGDIDLVEVQGGIDLKTRAGKVNLRRVTPTLFRVAAGSGDVIFSGQLPDGGENSIRTSSGTISIFVSKESSLSLDASTETGSITIDEQMPLEGGAQSDKLVRGAVNGGRASVVLATASGNIEVGVGEPWWR